MKIVNLFIRKLNLSGRLFLLIVLLHQILSACTIFNKTSGDTVLVGNNEDWVLTESQVMFYPASQGKYGRMYFGFNNNGYGGMNTYGLFYDVCALTHREIEFPTDKPLYTDDFWEFALETCATVDEVVSLAKQYYIESLSRHHAMFVDSTGNSAIIEWAQDSMAVIYKSNNFQVVSNFTISDPNLAGWYPCARYTKASRMLKLCDVSIDHFKTILDSVHQEGNFATQYSNIYDLKNRTVYVYRLYNYDEVVMFNLIEELKKGDHIFDLPGFYTNIEALYNESKSPKQFQLYQNYPNPFNATTTIEFDISKEKFVTIKIFNILGKEEYTLVNDEYAPGSYRITWKGINHSNVPVETGLYFIRLVAGDLMSTKKIMIMK